MLVVTQMFIGLAGLHPPALLKPTTMKKYYFTFGPQHFTKEGLNLEDYYVTVEAFNGQQARSLFLNHFMRKEMNSLSDFSYQYDEEDFREIQEHCTAGEYRKFVLLDLSELNEG